VHVIISYILLLAIIRLLMIQRFNKKIFTAISGLGIFFIAALRSKQFGPDTYGYVRRYIAQSYESFASTWSEFISFELTDPFFFLFRDLINITGASYQVWLGILSGIFIFSASKVIYRYSDEPYISYISLISLGYLYFSFTGLRQAMAIPLILLSYQYLRERKLWPFIFIVLVASLFHASALIFLIAYPLANIKLGYKHYLGIIAALIVAMFLGDYIRYLVEIFGWTETIAGYAERERALTLAGFIIQLFIFLFCLFYKNNVLEADNKNLSLYNLLFLGLIFQSFTPVIAEFFRISMYFSIFGIILIPKAINAEKDKKLKVVVYLGIICALIAYIFYQQTFSDFKFFWN